MPPVLLLTLFRRLSLSSTVFSAVTEVTGVTVLNLLSGGRAEVANFGTGQVGGRLDREAQGRGSQAQGTRKPRETTFERRAVDKD